MASNMAGKTLLLFALFLMSIPPCIFSHHEKNDLHLFFYPEGEKSSILDNNNNNNNNFCKNGGVLKQLEGKKECFCGGTMHYGLTCHID